MLSIAIPIYNYPVLEFVTALREQCQECKIPFEILCIDDASPQNEAKQANQALKDMSGVTYVELSENIGRSAIRNRLLGLSKYDHLLFLDCDGAITSKEFISQYVSAIPSGQVIVGGRIYLKNKPETSTLLHWTYGSAREISSAAVRNKNPYYGFMSNNFLIQKSVMTALNFDEEIKTYGHEDTLFGKRLEEEKISIYHIDNPVIHLGLDQNTAFISKTVQALENLIRIDHKVENLNIKLLVRYNSIKSVLKVYYSIAGECTISYLLKNLQSDKPNLKYFDFFRLLTLVKIENKK